MKILALLAVLALPAAAADPAPPANKPEPPAAKASKGLDACRADIERFCAKVKPGDRRLARCLNKSFKKLSPACRAFADHGGRRHRLDALADLDKMLAPPAAP